MTLGLDPNVLRQIAPKCDADVWAPHLSTSMQEFGVASPLQRAMFLAQACEESMEFTHLRESFNYHDAHRIIDIFRKFDLNHNHLTDENELAFAQSFVGRQPELADYVYADRLGNGPESSGDGWAYRGGGIFQLTGRDNYRACGRALGIQLEDYPELIATPVPACRSAGWFWQGRQLNLLSDMGDIVGVTHQINGGANGLDARRDYFAKARTALAA